MDDLTVTAALLLIISYTALGYLHTMFTQACVKATAALKASDYENASLTQHLPFEGIPHMVGLFLAVVSMILSSCYLLGNLLHIMHTLMQ